MKTRTLKDLNNEEESEDEKEGSDAGSEGTGETTPGTEDENMDDGEGTGDGVGDDDGSGDVDGTERSFYVPDKHGGGTKPGGTSGTTTAGGKPARDSGTDYGSGDGGSTEGGTGGVGDITSAEKPDKKPEENPGTKTSPKKQLTEETTDQLEQPYVPEEYVVEMFPNAKPHPFELAVPTSLVVQDEETAEATVNPKRPR